MKGIIRKYHADPTQEDLRDCADKSGCTELISDPDFWSNRFPIWSICGPYVRNNLKKDDIIFFLPNKKSLAKLKLVEPICTGVLYVSEIIYDSDQLRKKVDEGYYKKSRKRLCYLFQDITLFPFGQFDAGTIKECDII